MTISTTVTSVQYLRNGTTTQWGWPNKIFAAADLTVSDLDTSVPPVATLLILGTDYTVSNVDVDTGAIVTTTLPGIAGHSLDVRSNTSQVQTTSIKNQGSYLPELHEEFFDRVTREVQDLTRKAYTFGIHGPDIEATPWPALPPSATRRNTALMFDASTGLPTLGIPTTQTMTQGLIGLLLYPQTAAELAASITPTNYFYPQGDSRRYGVIGNNVADDTVAVNNWIKICVAAQIAGTLYPGTFLISSPVVINLLGHGFELLGPSASSCIFSIASTFSGSTSAFQIKGNGSPCQWRLGGWSVQPSGGGSGTAVIGFLVGDPTVAAINILGYNFSTIQDIQVSNFATLWEYVNCRMIRNVDCSGWDLLGTVVTAVLITQGTASAPCFTGDIVFDTCQYVTTTAANNICVNILSNQGPYNNSTGFGSIAAIKFKTCDFYAGSTAISVTASAQSQIADCWWTDGCQIDQQTATAMSFTSLNSSTTINDIHIEGIYINKSTTAGISFASTGTGGQVNQIWIQNCWIDNAQQNAITFFGAACQDLHVNNNEIVDCVTSGRAIEFNGASRIQCNFNRATVGILAQKPQWLIGFDAGCTDIEAIGNNGVGMTLSGATIIDQSGVIANKMIVNNPGYNPIGSNAITVTASPFTFTNSTGAPVIVYTEGGTTSAPTTANGLAVAATGATNFATTLQQGGAVIVTYSAAPTMTYFGL